MARSYRPVIRDQEFLLPPNMADWLPQDHLVWFVLDVVDQLDTSRFHARRRTGGVGRRGYDPDMLLALLVYAYAVGERSSRRIERLCTDHVAFRVLCGQDGPDHSTLARFRADHHAAFTDLFAQVLGLCSAAGMVKVGVVSIDGTKIAANAARHSNRSPKTIRARAKEIAQDIVADADATDATEDTAEADNHDDGLPPTFKSRGQRAVNIKKALAELDRQDAEHAKADAIDEEAAETFLRRVKDGSASRTSPPRTVDPVRYHQARIDREEARIAAVDTALANGEDVSKKQMRSRHDARWILKKATVALAKAEQDAAAGNVDLRGRAQRSRDRRARQSRERGGKGVVVNTTDPDSRLMSEGSGGGSVQGYNAQIAVTDDHFILGVHVSQDANDSHCYLPTLTEASLGASLVGKEIELVLADAGYFTDTNLTAPGPPRLIAPGKNRDVHHDAKIDPADSEPPPDASPQDQMRHRLRQPENADRYKRRGATVETVIAHLKDQTGLRRFTHRGLVGVKAELNLAAAVVNLRRLHTMQNAT